MRPSDGSVYLNVAHVPGFWRQSVVRCPAKRHALTLGAEICEGSRI
jgi:hypothetical protein